MTAAELKWKEVEKCVATLAKEILFQFRNVSDESNDDGSVSYQRANAAHEGLREKMRQWAGLLVAHEKKYGLKPAGGR